MAHKTLIDGTAYAVKGGRDLIAGTGYAKKNGKTIINGTVYKINFDKKSRIEIKNGKESFHEYGYVRHNKQKITEGTIDVEEGETLEIYLYSDYGNSYVYLHGDTITVRNYYSYAVSTDATLSFEFSSAAACRITEK